MDLCFENIGASQKFFLPTYSALLHLPPLRFRMLGFNPGLLQLLHWQSDALTTRLGLIRLG
jgi:hypothetical protein